MLERPAYDSAYNYSVEKLREQGIKTALREVLYPNTVRDLYNYCLLYTSGSRLIRQLMGQICLRRAGTLLNDLAQLTAAKPLREAKGQDVYKRQRLNRRGHRPGKASLMWRP